MKTTDGLTDDYIKERACSQPRCRNWAAQGVIYCINHLHGFPSEMPLKVWHRKLEMEQEEHDKLHKGRRDITAG